jgi:hypothetical protein
MVGAGEFTVIFDALIRFLCIGFMPRHDERFADSAPYTAHASMLVALRQTQRFMDSRALTQIELTLLRLQLFASRRELDVVRRSGRIAMDYLRVLCLTPNVALQMTFPAPVHAFRERIFDVPRGIIDVELGYQLSVQRGELLDMWNPPTAEDDSEDTGSDYAAAVPDDDASVVTDDDAGAVPDDAALLANVFEEEREPDEEEDIRFMDGSPLLDVVRF